MALGHSLPAMTVTGSDLVVAPVQEALAKQLQALGVTADFDFAGSLIGKQKLSDGTADAAILAVPNATQAIDSNRTFPFCFQIVAFAVHSTNPVTELTYNQLTSLYETDGVLNDWADLTPDLNWRDRKISLWVTRSKSAITLEIFNSTVLTGRPLKSSVRYAANDSETLQSIVQEDSSAIVAVPAIPRIPSIRFLAIKQDEAGQAYTPSEDNVLFGDYPLRLPFYLVVSEKVGDEDMAKLVRAIYAPEVTEALRAVNYLPVSQTEQQSLLSQFE